MCRFYSGLDPEKCFRMPIEFFNQMWLAITVIEAQEAIQARNVAGWPYVSKADREKIHKDLFKEAYPSSMEGDKPVDLKSLYEKLRANTGKG